jgi:hypothetical protein
MRLQLQTAKIGGTICELGYLLQEEINVWVCDKKNNKGNQPSW